MISRQEQVSRQVMDQLQVAWEAVDQALSLTDPRRFGVSRKRVEFVSTLRSLRAALMVSWDELREIEEDEHPERGRILRPERVSRLIALYRRLLPEGADSVPDMSPRAEAALKRRAARQRRSRPSRAKRAL